MPYVELGTMLRKQMASRTFLGSTLNRFRYSTPGVPVHNEITIVLSLFRSHWLAVVYCSVLYIGSCELVHEDRISLLMVCIIKPGLCFVALWTVTSRCTPVKKFSVSMQLS